LMNHLWEFCNTTIIKIDFYLSSHFSMLKKLDLELPYNEMVCLYLMYDKSAEKLQ